MEKVLILTDMRKMIKLSINVQVLVNSSFLCNFQQINFAWSIKKVSLQFGGEQSIWMLNKKHGGLILHF